jgi:hypothetical protein
VHLGHVETYECLVVTYRVVGAAVHHAMSHNHAPRAYGDLGMSCGDLRKA